MMKIGQRCLGLLVVLGLCGFSWPFSWLQGTEITAPLGSRVWLDHEMSALKAHSTIDEKVLRLSLIAYLNARKKGYAEKPLLTVIDYSKPSSERRLWVFDLKRGKTLFNTWVSHGQNSGDVNSTSFSNSYGSLKSSIGVFVTGEPYIGGNGYSLRIRGLESGVNDHAYSRDIVIHGARYVNADIIRRYGRIGRSWGCPAVSTNLAAPLIDTIKDDTVLIAYYPDRHWLTNSRFLTG